MSEKIVEMKYSPGIAAFEANETGSEQGESNDFPSTPRDFVHVKTKTATKIKTEKMSRDALKQKIATMRQSYELNVNRADKAGDVVMKEAYNDMVKKLDELFVTVHQGRVKNVELPPAAVLYKQPSSNDGQKPCKKAKQPQPNLTPRYQPHPLNPFHRHPNKLTSSQPTCPNPNVQSYPINAPFQNPTIQPHPLNQPQQDPNNQPYPPNPPQQYPNNQPYPPNPPQQYPNNQPYPPNPPQQYPNNQPYPPNPPQQYPNNQPYQLNPFQCPPSKQPYPPHLPTQNPPVPYNVFDPNCTQSPPPLYSQNTPVPTQNFNPPQPTPLNKPNSNPPNGPHRLANKSWTSNPNLSRQQQQNQQQRQQATASRPRIKTSSPQKFRQQHNRQHQQEDRSTHIERDTKRAETKPKHTKKSFDGPRLNQNWKRTENEENRKKIFKKYPNKPRQQQADEMKNTKEETKNAKAGPNDVKQDVQGAKPGSTKEVHVVLSLNI